MHRDLFPETLLVTIEDGHTFTTSLKIAEYFHKLHKNVLRAIESSECSDRFRRLNFEPANYLDKQKKPRQMYRITKDGFWMLAMGFTGKEAAQWRENFIDAFNAMESELRSKTERFARALDVVRPHLRPVTEATERGNSRAEIGQLLDKSPASVSYHRRSARRLGLLAA